MIKMRILVTMPGKHRRGHVPSVRRAYYIIKSISYPSNVTQHKVRKAFNVLVVSLTAHLAHTRPSIVLFTPSRYGREECLHKSMSPFRRQFGNCIDAWKDFRDLKAIGE